MEVLKTENLTKCFGKKVVVDNINMTINKGDIYGFIGKNGAGKTTLMRMILTLARPTSGTFTLFGSDDILTQCKKIGSLIETPSIPGGITAKEALRRYSMLYGADMGKIDDIIRTVGLSDAGNKKISQYSLGMKQRIGIAIALLNDPEFLILDEPLNGLDPVGMKEIRNLIISLNKDKGITFLISSHLLEELSKTATRIGIIDGGRLIEEIGIDEVYEKSLDEMELQYTVNDTAKAIEIIKNDETFNSETGIGERVRIHNNNIIITGSSGQSAYYNRILVTGGVDVSEIKISGNNLEDYYVDKVGKIS